MKIVFCMEYGSNRSDIFILNHSKRAWSDMSKVLQSNKLVLLHIVRLQQKQTIEGKLPKFWWETKIFLPVTNLHCHEI